MPERNKDKTRYTSQLTTEKRRRNTCKPCAPGLVPPLPLALDEFGAQTPEPQPPLNPNPPNGDWDGELKFPCIGAGGKPVPKLVGLQFSCTAGGDGKVGGNTALAVAPTLAPVPVK